MPIMPASKDSQHLRMCTVIQLLSEPGATTWCPLAQSAASESKAPAEWLRATFGQQSREPKAAL